MKGKKFSSEDVLKKNSVIVGPLSNNPEPGLGMMVGVVNTLKQLAAEGVTKTVIDIGQSYERLVSKK